MPAAKKSETRIAVLDATTGRAVATIPVREDATAAQARADLYASKIIGLGHEATFTTFTHEVSK